MISIERIVKVLFLNMNKVDMRTISLIICLTALTFQIGISQSIAEGLRYADVSYGTTARSLGVGGSFSGLGPDISVASSNPAGLAEFRKSEFVISGALNNGVLEASLNGDRQSLSSYPFALQNLGMTFSYAPIASNWTSTNFTIGVNKVASFDERFSYRSTTPGTIVERFVETANTNSIDEITDRNSFLFFEPGLAWETGAIFDFDGDFFYESDFLTYTEQVFKAQTVETSGGISELVASLSGSRNNKLNLGITVGIPFISYNSTKNYIEEDANGTIDFFDNLEFVESLTTTGVGFNAKFGLLYKLTPKIRVGAAIHSPTTFFLTDDFFNDLTYGFTEDGASQAITEESNLGNQKYRIKTPWKALLSGAYLLNFENIKGFITAEAEYIDYSGISFGDLGDSVLEEDLNNQAATEFQSGLNLRIGSELAFSKFRVRAGVGLISPAYEDGNPIGDLSNTLNLGAGFRGNKFYFDLAVESKNKPDRYVPYFVLDDSRNQVVDVDKTLRRLVVTAGVKI